jgi:N-acetylglucosamine-6-phosphate deacetylase
MIDIHIHGGYGCDVMDGELIGLEKISKNLPAEGVTSFLATTMTMGKNKIEGALASVADYGCRGGPMCPPFSSVNNSSIGAELLGVNLEGPFIAPKKACAQEPKNILAPNITLFEQWQNLAKNSIKIVTLAPEIDNSLEMAKYLAQHGVVVSFGHSDADYECGRAAIKAGFSHVTHLFNAMRNFHHREPNAVTAFLLDENTSAEVIADGIHLHPAILQLVFVLKGTDNIILISDAMRAKGMPDGTYEFGGHQVTAKNEQVRLPDGALAGSILPLDQAMRNMLHYTSCSFAEVVKMVTGNPAKKVGVFERKGSIALNKDADLVILNERYEVMMTLCRGQIAYEHRSAQG